MVSSPDDLDPLLRYALPAQRAARAAEDLARLAGSAPPAGQASEVDSRPPPLDRLAEVAFQLRTMPYGQFVAFAEQIEAKPATVWRWATEYRG